MQLGRLRIYLRLGNEGTALMEAGIVFPFLLLSYIGIVLITQYLDTHRKLFQTANQIATAMSMERKGDKAKLDNVLKYANITTAPDDVSVSYIFCGDSTSSPGTIVPASPLLSGVAGKGKCGRGSGTSTFKEVAKCPVASPGPNYSQFVVVTTSCKYSPSFNALGLLNISMGTTVNIPIREGKYILP